MKGEWVEEPDGLWYYSPGRTRRQRGRWGTCKICGERFPATRRVPGSYCTKKCWGRDVKGAPPATRLDLFERWSPAECWLAGLLWADGHYCVRQSWSSVQLNLTDEEAIAHAAKITGGRYRTHEQHVRDGYVRKPVHRMTFGERHAVARLVAVGFAEPKLTTRSWPNLPHLASFLRGAFDGDGSVLLHQQGGLRKLPTSPLRLHASLCGSERFLAGVQRFLAGYDITPKKIINHNGVWKIQWNHTDSLRLAGVLYSEPGPLLSRKKAIFDRA